MTRFCMQRAIFQQDFITVLSGTSMSSRIGTFTQSRRNVLNGYDIMAKSLPGMALLVGLSTFLPQGTWNSIPIKDSLITSLATFLLVVALLGLLIGEAVHTLAETIEKGIFKPVYIIEQLSKKGQKIIYNFMGLTSPSSDAKHIDNVKPSKAYKILTLWKLNLVFKQHRELLIDMVQENYNHFLGFWEKNQKGELFDDFSATIEDIYGVNVKDNPESLSFLYPSIMSRVFMSQARLSKRFQIIFSFCRSMWMTFLILTIGYSTVLFLGPPVKVVLPFIEEYTPIVMAAVIKSPLPLWMLPTMTLLTTLGFLAACGKYKYHYIEYIIADFPSVASTNNRNPSPITFDGGSER